MYRGVTIYYEKKIGYLIGSMAQDYKTKAPIILKPIKQLDSDIDDDLLLEEIQKSIQISTEISMYYGDNTYDYWKDTGIKSFKTFSSVFSAVKIFVFNEQYKIQKLQFVKGTGGYRIDKNNYLEICALELPNSINRIKEFLNMKGIEDDKYGFLTTLSDIKVSYFNISNSYLDIGDGHTDAYQIYAHDTYDKNYIGFMIDSGYDSFLSEDIQTKWKQYYGDLNTFEYQEVSNAEYYTKVVATTNELEIQSYLFKDGEGTLELIFEIDLLTTPKEEQNKIRCDFISLVESVKLNEK